VRCCGGLGSPNCNLRVPLTLSVGVWYALELTLAPATGGGQDFTVAVDGITKLSGRAYGYIQAGAQLRAIVGSGSRYDTTHIRFDNLRVEVRGDSRTNDATTIQMKR
jgi:hypothetical protein